MVELNDACECGDCDGGCSLVGLERETTDGEMICDECAMGIHEQDRRDDEDDDGS